MMAVMHMKENEMRNYLPNTDIYLTQRRDMFRFNTDTHLLGDFAKCKEGDSVLDIGTNNGALLLYVSRYKPKMLCGIDVFREAIELCERNLKDNQVHNYELFTCRLQDFSHEPFDVIVSNPPYFTSNEGNTQLSENEFIRTARHEVNLTMSELLSKVSELLVDGGTFYMVHRASRLADIVELCGVNHLGITKLQFVYDENNDVAVQVLVEARKNLCHNISILRPQHLKR